MKIVIALACLVAFAAAVEETAGQIDVDLDGAEHRHGGGHGGGYGGGFGGHHGGRFGRSPQKPIFRPHPTPRPPIYNRKGRSVDEILEPVAVQIADQDVAEQYWSPYVNPVDQVAISADQDVAEQRYGGHGGGRGGHGGGRRYGRSLEEAQPFIVAEFQPEYVDYVSDDLQLAENRYYGGNRGHGGGGYRGRRSVEDENAVAIEDLEVAENRGGSYNRGHSSGGSGYGHSGSYSNRGSSGGSGYGGQHRGRRSVQEIAGAIEDLEVAEHHNKGYNRGGSSGGSGQRRKLQKQQRLWQTQQRTWPLGTRWSSLLTRKKRQTSCKRSMLIIKHRKQKSKTRKILRSNWFGILIKCSFGFNKTISTLGI
ncbi:DEAD-box ATP-dependent RNA helicase 9-like isoform X5 [Daphnia pulicaria]|uniref:DEAD-box ATP-dependent RNA helicase 9-like isoform X3 n=1 Tax=Daphnia pulicaria TaxID=35523 RepID=UPI001EEA65CB|nr:DEAD-box ATP-dependent RNA helicase 9-like isoform X3 [Daphnia pulicaria]XP_046650118.1 DEAD-box ATP-dependent RNA helicase 9-like isoform X4 [Daphnia pulicaria]XP_046650119.1 DEAD-box ATP-dependent RNA helicase 9-like isoform X5 [Daphnia pulicaria]